ncbi:MAG: MCE family protein [Planctomycetes bacterium]|nr:MCE family protein [Planctomycetota bacterium]NBY01749.1 MCE family protein [Planctomycetota bacterium]
MTRTLNNKQLLLLICTMLAGLALFAIAFFSIGSRGWYSKDSLSLKTSFLDIRGVDVGTRVRIQGMDAGEVVSINAPENPGGPVVLELKIQGTYRKLIRKDAIVSIASEGLLGAKVLELFPGSSSASTIENQDFLASKNNPEFAEILGEVSDMLGKIRKGEGSLGKLTQDSKLYDSLVQLANQSQQTMQAFQQDADALKKMPIVGGYIEDPMQMIVRSNTDMKRKSINSSNIFEAGSAILSPEGKKILDKASEWLIGFPKDSDIVIAGVMAPGVSDRDTLRLRTRQQAETVADYLKNNHAIHKTGWFSRRKVNPIGLGDKSYPGLEATPESESSRIELLVFINRG